MIFFQGNVKTMVEEDKSKDTVMQKKMALYLKDDAE